jgi:hypothetical protein
MLISVAAVWRHKAVQTPWRLTVFSSRPPTKMEDPMLYETLEGDH